jgi:monoamine oxidase
VIHVVGAGLAGLAAATALLDAGAAVTVHEAAPEPGGRCRSYHDPVLDRRIDTGTHLLLGANRAALAYVRRLGALDRLSEGEARYEFFDLRRGTRRTVRPTLPGLASVFRPVALAALNTDPSEASWRLLGAVFRRLVGERACRPWIARSGIGDALIAPAVQRLGARLLLGHRLTGFEIEASRVVGLCFGAERLGLAAGDGVILAVPAWVAGTLLPGPSVPNEFRAIVNAHYRIGAPAAAPRLIGLSGGRGQWLLWRDDVVSVTVSAAEAIVDAPAEALAAQLWQEAARALNRSEPLPLHRVIKERRATVAATAAQERRRPGARTEAANLWLAGDWTATGLPGTLESAVLSGETAMRLALAAD